MKVAKLVFGILSIVLSLIVTFQSCAAGAVNTLSDNGEVSGSAGLFVSILMLSGGIVMIACRKGKGKGGAIAGLVIYGIAAVLGMTSAGSFSDLKVWAFFCGFLAVLNLLSMFGKKKNDDAADNSEK